MDMSWKSNAVCNIEELKYARVVVIRLTYLQTLVVKPSRLIQLNNYF